MVAIVADEAALQKLIADRRAKGIDGHDEVWDGEYFMAPIANDEHQDIAGELTHVFIVAVRIPGLGLVRPGVNVSDRETDWTQNFRVPDVVVFLNGTSAVNRGSHWLGGPDFAVEIVSPGDRSREKLGFYAGVGTREVLLIERDPWRLELFRLNEVDMQSVGEATVEDGEKVVSAVIPLSFELSTGPSRPSIIVRHAENDDEWFV